MSVSLLSLVQAIAKDRGLGFASGVPTAGATTTTTDSSSDSPFSTGDGASLFANAWIKITADSAGTPRNVGDVRRITTYTVASQQVTHDAFAYVTATTMTYNIYMGIPPTRVGLDQGLDEWINTRLRNSYYKDLFLITLAPDGDMEATGTTSYSGTNATLAKVTSGSGVTQGDQALQVTTTAADGYATMAANLDVSEGEVYEFCVDTTPASGSWKIQTWDVTAGAEIDVSDAYAGTQARRLWLRSSVPTDCERINVRLIGETITTVCTFDNLTIRDAQGKRLVLPSWFTDDKWLEEVWVYPPGTERDQAYSITERNRSFPQWWNIEESYTANTPFRLELDEAYGIPRASHLFIQAIRPYGELATDAATTDADQDFVKYVVLVDIYNDRDDKANAARCVARFNSLGLTRHLPRVRRRLMTGRVL